MSDTPRTDSYVYKFPGCQREPRLIDFARQLERELAEAQERLVDANKNLSDYLDTVLAMIFAARGGGCDPEALEREMNAVSKKPSEYIQHIISTKDNQLAEARAETERLALEIENQQYTITCESEENQQLKESLAEARAEIDALRTADGGEQL